MIQTTCSRVSLALRDRGLPPIDSLKQPSDSYTVCRPVGDAFSILDDGRTTNVTPNPWGVSSAYYEAQVDQVVATPKRSVHCENS
jgi:hypothetical protein